MKKKEKPFEVGQLIRRRRGMPGGLLLVLDVKWSSDDSLYVMRTVSQQTGKKQWFFAGNFVLAGGSDE